MYAPCISGTVNTEHGNRNGNEDQGLSSAPKDHDPCNLQNSEKGRRTDMSVITIRSREGKKNNLP